MEPVRTGDTSQLEARLWSIDDLSTYLGVPVGTLYHWRSKCYGPAGVKVGRAVKYRRTVVDAWLDAQSEGV